MLSSPLALAVVVISAALTVALAAILVWDVFGGKLANNTYFHATPKGLLIRTGGTGRVIAVSRRWAANFNCAAN